MFDKVNLNFDEIIEIHGGSQGRPGPTGADGAIGDRGKPGPTGNSGVRGNRWFIDISQPAGSGDTVIQGDYWVNRDSGIISIFTSSGWEPTGYSLSDGDSIFKNTESIFSTGITGSAISLNQVVPSDYLVIIADKTPGSGVLNESLSKFLISTDTTVNDSPILEFSKTNVENGNISDYSQHPIFRWNNFTPTDNGLVLEIPGGTFVIGASGGSDIRFNEFIMNSPGNIEFNYGTTSGSGIYSTGGFEINAPSGQFSMLSANISITGGTSSMSAPVQLNPSLPNGVYSTYLYSGGTAPALRTTRSGDTFSTLSNNVYNISLESSNGGQRDFFIDTRGKIRTKKTETGISYTNTTPSATGPANTNWYMITRTGTPIDSSVLQDGNTMVINPVVPTSGFIGIGIYTGSDYSLGTTGGIDRGESIDINILISPNSVSFPSNGITFIGAGTTSGNVTNRVTLSNIASSLDLTIARGVTGDNTTVFYRSYGTNGGSGGSFTI
jgi:hypothetical protein